VKEGRIPEDWKSSVVLPIYKGKGDPMECGSYRGVKLLEYAIHTYIHTYIHTNLYSAKNRENESDALKVVEKIFEHRIRHRIEIDVMQFGFMKGKGTTDAIFMEGQMQENFRVKGNKRYFGFVDLEKALTGCQER